MSNVAQPGWLPDPYGRFAQRYWDGVQWTANVSDGGGGQYSDAPVPSAPGTVAPFAAAGAAGAYGAPAMAASRTQVPTVALAVVGAGALLLVLSDFVLPWFSVGDLDFNLSDVRKAASQSENVPFITEQYLTWGWLVGLAAVALAVGALFNPKLRVAAAAVLFVVAAWHGWTAFDAGDENVSAEFGAYLGTIGLVVCGAAALLPTSKFLAAMRQ